MRAKIIVLSGDATSFKHADACINSSIEVGNNFEISKFRASEPQDVKEQMRRYLLEWNYPWNGEVIRDMKSGLTKTGYMTATPEKRIACFLSHYRLWMECVEMNEDYLILEHDAICTKRLDTEFLADCDKLIISVNQPQPGATPQALKYEQHVALYGAQKGTRVVPVPLLKTWDIPAGLPGNSAYYIKPEGAKLMLNLAKEYGAWPNDALMCKQLVGPDNIGCLYPFATRTIKSLSTTTL